MYIKNIKTGVVQECRNNDVIKVCRKQPDEYQLAENREELDSGATKPETPDKKEKSLSGMKVDELKVLAKENGIEGYDSLTKPELLEVLKDVIVND